MRRLQSKTLVPVILTGLLTVPVLADGHRQLDLSIVGTKVEFDKVGLPTRLEGMVFFRGGPRDGGIAGTYEETLRPSIDPELGLVGTIGESVFHFVRRNGGTVGWDKVVTRNRSTIVGEIPRDGALLVESTGRIIGERSDHGGGTLRSSATVRLGPKFELDVKVSLIFGNSEKAARSPSSEGGDAAEKTSLVVTVGADGETRVRYSREFKRRVLRRLTGPGAVSAAALSAEIGLSEALLSRWGQQARLLAVLRRVQGALRPAQRQRTFEEKLGVVLKTAAYSEEELEEFVSLEGVSKEDLAEWRHAIESVVEAAIRGSGKSNTEDEGKAEGADPSDGARGLEELKKRVEALLGNGPPDEEESGSGEAKSP